MTPSVLIVDDSLTVRMDLRDRFASAGFAVADCDSLAGAWEALAGQRFSLIVLDVLLPDGDGVGLLRELKAGPATASIPVILLSTEAEVRDRVRGLETGADDYIGKPYDAANLLARARQLLGETEPAAGSRTLLLIDDSATFRHEFQTMLEAAGYAVASAPSGEEGLRAAVATRPIGIIVDGTLPGGIDGATVIRRLKQDVALRDTPCMLLTGSETLGDELRVLEAGADAYVRKSDGIEVILARIVALLRPGAAPPSRAFGSSLLGPKRILTVDDSVTYLHELADELRQEGYDVILATSGDEAIELLEHQPADCILLDLVMPGLSGQETCRMIKQRPAWRNIPLIILTAVENTRTMIDGINAGADDYIPKSSDFEVLKARVRAQLRRKQFEDEYRSIQDKLLEKEREAAKARTAQSIAEAKAALVGELERKNREMEAFSYAVSHDLRAPLRAIQGFSEILLQQRDQITPTAQAQLDRVLKAASRMSVLIDALLELSGISRRELRRTKTDLSALAQTVLRDLAASAPQRQVEIVVPEGIRADADPALMQIVLDNLLGNAWKFTARVERARIEIGVLREPGAPPVYFVRDNGGGFDMRHVERLFRPFQRLHTQAEFPGTGVGLATVSRIVERHGGRIWAESQVGQGATFFFTLCAASTELKAAAAGAAHA